ncbi:MAG: regulatory protein RecX [Gammaproteobacteria bacterium]|nr:regulatory protein RecX [Gammaproteobacteria bacterium]
MSEPLEEIRRKALELLAAREHTRVELARKLRRRGSPAPAIEQTLDALAAEGHLSDDRFAEAYVRRRAGAGFGPLRIQQELRERGVDPGVIAGHLDAEAHDWVARAAQAREKRFGRAPPANRREWLRQARFLDYRGFTGEQIRRALPEGGSETHPA